MWNLISTYLYNYLQEERMKEYRRENRLKRKRKAETETSTEDADVDVDMAAMMGFSGFGSSKK